MSKFITAFVCLLSVFVSSGVMQSKSVDGGTTANLVPWTDNQLASRVLGQTNFTTATGGAGNNKFLNPFGVAVDPTTGKVFVSEFSNNRVLRFTSLQAATNGGTAEAVLGQPDFDTVTTGTAQNRMNGPQGIAADSAGRLWVAESGNNRVLRFDNAAAKANGANADAVLGQPNFTTATSAITQSGMNLPTGVVVDSAGRLWVADRSNSRVLRFDNAAAKANGANADGVLGQPNFTTGSATVLQDRMNNPVNPTVDLAGRLYVPDRNNHRILIFDNAAALGNGAPASNVLGQPGFTTATANNGGISASSLNLPLNIFFDEASQNLFVPDASNNRVLRFSAGPPTAAAVTVAGRVTANGTGLRNAIVTLTDTNGNSRSVRTSAFGYYHFDEIEAGQTVVIAVQSKRFTFTPQVVSVTENIADLDFTAQ